MNLQDQKFSIHEPTGTEVSIHEPTGPEAFNTCGFEDIWNRVSCTSTNNTANLVMETHSPIVSQHKKMLK